MPDGSVARTLEDVALIKKTLAEIILPSIGKYPPQIFNKFPMTLKIVDSRHGAGGMKLQGTSSVLIFPNALYKSNDSEYQSIAADHEFYHHFDFAKRGFLNRDKSFEKLHSDYCSCSPYDNEEDSLTSIAGLIFSVFPGYNNNVREYEDRAVIASYLMNSKHNQILLVLKKSSPSYEDFKRGAREIWLGARTARGESADDSVFEAELEATLKITNAKVAEIKADYLEWGGMDESFWQQIIDGSLRSPAEIQHLIDLLSGSERKH